MQPHDSEDSFIQQNSPDSPAEGGDTHWAYIEELLQHTLKAKDPIDVLSPQDREALLEVARRHGGEPFGLEPVGVELVQAMLSSFFSTWGKDPVLWRPMAMRVARTLFEDSPSQERLKRIWRHLREVA